ncbi:hypothetical protein GGR53DRAFT_392971 [Hypoxylon sp. FL1150]|nr:hypothetical protein GGR53DRAFT_392971 [Hypoxylon sp. FL1150]
MKYEFAEEELRMSHEESTSGCPSEPLTTDALRRHDGWERPSRQAPNPEDQHECTMCCETIPISHLTTLPCGHQLHPKCLRNWVYHRQTRGRAGYPAGQGRCPICRRSLLYVCQHRISKHLLRPGVHIRMCEDMLNQLVFLLLLLLVQILFENSDIFCWLFVPPETLGERC